MLFVVLTLYLLPFVFWFYSDGSAICRIRDLPLLQAARLVMVMVVLKVKRLMFVA